MQPARAAQEIKERDDKVSSFSQRREAFRKRIDAPHVITAVGAYDALSAKMVEACGFDAVFVSGYALAATIGLPDVGLITMTELVDRSRYILESTKLPVIVDVDTGFGTTTHVARTIRLVEDSGISGVHIEDQVFPKKCGAVMSKNVIPAEEMEDKIKVAVDSRRDPNMLIIARTDAIAVNGLDDAIERANRFAEAGADMAFVCVPPTVNDLEQIARRTKAPLMITSTEHGATPMLTLDEFERLGYRMVVYPITTLLAGAFGMRQALNSLREGRTNAGILDRMLTWQEMNELMDDAHWRAIEERGATASQ